MHRLLRAALLPFLLGCSLDSFAVVKPGEVRVSAPDGPQAERARAALVDVDRRLRERLPGLRDWRDCDDVHVNWFRGLQRMPPWAANRWTAVNTETLLYHWLMVLPDRAPADHERDLLHGVFLTLADDAWQALPDCARLGLCDAVWSEGWPDRENVLAADAAMALDAGLQVVVGELQGPWLSRHRELDWGEPSPRQLLPHRADGYQMLVHHDAWAAWVGEGCGVGLDWLLARRLLDRVGGEGLHSLAVAHPEGVPWTVLLEAAGLGPDEDTWRDALDGRLDAGTLAVIARVNARRLAPPLAALGRSASGAAALQDMLARARPRLRWPEGAELLVDQVPEALTALREAWDRQTAAREAERSTP